MTQKFFTAYMAIIACLVVGHMLYKVYSIQGNLVCEDNKFVGEICK